MASNSRCGIPRRMVLRTRVPDDVLGFSVSALSAVVIIGWMTNWSECHPQRLRYLPVGEMRKRGKGFSERKRADNKFKFNWLDTPARTGPLGREERGEESRRPLVDGALDLGVFSQPQ